MGHPPFQKMYLLLKMVGFLIAMLVYQRVYFISAIMFLGTSPKPEQTSGWLMEPMESPKPAGHTLENNPFKLRTLGWTKQMRFMSWKAGILLDSLWYHVKSPGEIWGTNSISTALFSFKERHELVESNSSFQDANSSWSQLDWFEIDTSLYLSGNQTPLLICCFGEDYTTQLCREYFFAIQRILMNQTGFHGMSQTCWMLLTWPFHE